MSIINEGRCPDCKGYETKWKVTYKVNFSAVYCYKCDSLNLVDLREEVDEKQ